MDSFVESLKPYFEQPQLATEQLMELKLKELIYILCETGKGNTIHYILGTLFQPEQINFKNTVEANLFNNLTISELAHLTTRSESTFKRDFKKIYGVSPAKYIKTKRLEKAEKILRTSDQSISSVAWDCGFENVAHFSNSFRLQYGHSPRSYRK